MVDMLDQLTYDVNCKMHEFHEIADAFPLMQGDDFTAFCDDIRANGLRLPIVIHPNGQILDGRNRERACDITGTEPRYETWAGEHGTEISYVISLNLARRHLSESQRGMVAGRLAKMPQGARTDLASIEAMSQPEAAQALNVSRSTVQRAKTVLDSGTPELINAVDQGKIDLGPAVNLAKAPAETQREVVEMVKAGAKAPNAVRQALIQKSREEKTNRILEESKAGDGPEAKVKRYSVLLADPPWRYDHPLSTSREIENQYPTMTDEEIFAIDIGAITTDAAILYLWVPSSMIKHGIAVVEAWGFTYRTCLAWVKDKLGMGYWARQRHELLFVGIKGDMPTPAPETIPDSVIEAPRAEHSAKPEKVYGMIERQWPTLPRLELFARGERTGWDRWGHEA